MPYKNPMRKAFKQWTPREVVVAQTGRQQGLTNNEIGTLLNRNPKSVQEMFRAYGEQPLERFLEVRERLAKQRILNGIIGREKIAAAREKAREKAKQKYSKDYKSERSVIPSVTHVAVPPHVIAERDQREQEYRSPQQIMMGDPAPTRSALGRRCD